MFSKKKKVVNMGCTFWTSVRSRVASQLVISTQTGGVVLPQIQVVGTVTRRAVEKLWMVATDPSPQLIGSEIKAKIRAPEGYSFVGADVDSQELWIASLLRPQGGSAIF
eukprot:Lithocolla_globosa_v1_NODE_6288_length_1110_cov_4.883412.p1 type:complete len:109 gc:universal NODE_6288_length_1110_cov_4.883412:529-855(+)